MEKKYSLMNCELSFIAMRGTGTEVHSPIKEHFLNFDVVMTKPFSRTSTNLFWSMLTKYCRQRRMLLWQFYLIMPTIVSSIPMICVFSWY